MIKSLMQWVKKVWSIGEKREDFMRFNWKSIDADALIIYCDINN